MININGLRVGNIFWENYGGYKRVVGVNHHKHGYDIHASGIGYNAVGAYSPEDIYPVPLTSEMLEKCEFVKDGDGCYHKGNMYRISDSAVQLSIGYASVYNCPCEYLHQLQNLYFSLTGKELVFNLN